MEICTPYLHVGEVEISASTSRISFCTLNEIVNFSKLWQKDERNKRLGIILELSSGGPNFFWVLSESFVFVFKITLYVANKQKNPIPSRGFVHLALLGLISFLWEEAFHFLF